MRAFGFHVRTQQTTMPSCLCLTLSIQTGVHKSECDWHMKTSMNWLCSCVCAKELHMPSCDEHDVLYGLCSQWPLMQTRLS